MGNESRVSFSPGGSETAPIEPTAKARRQLDFSIRWIGSDGAHRVSSLQESKHTVGRDDTCDIVLPGAGASCRHCVIERSGGFVVEDLKSRNGVFVDGIRIDGTKQIADQSILRIGDWVGVLAEGDSTFHDAVASGLWGSY